MANRKDLVVFSHLRWNFVWQRPQQILSRLANYHRVFFVEEPISTEAAARPQWEFDRPSSKLTVCVPQTGNQRPGFHSEQFDDMSRLLAELIDLERLQNPIVWLYTPMAFPWVEQLQPCQLVYDCMDELSAFLNAPLELREYEQLLLRAADLVFTGGRSIFQVKREFNSNCHCFPSSVDLVHFRQARRLGLRTSRERPRLGFFGVIDERMDLELLRHCSAARPEWDWEFVGPVVKIDPEMLPKSPNIFYRGQQEYRDLPGYLGNWDVCLIPFALNSATRYISPTKTLEYMAAAKPIVSTPIHDIVHDFSDVVAIADNPERFIEHCEFALSQSEEARTLMIQKMDQVLSRTSWDQTVIAMSALLHEFDESPGRHLPRNHKPIAQPLNQEPQQFEYASQNQPGSIGISLNTLSSESRHYAAVMIGAGPTGLSCAYHLGANSLLIEKEAQVGGWCRSMDVGGFTFDYAGHIMFSNDPYVHELYDLLLGSNVHWQEREAWIYSHEVYTRYPFQGSLYGLPADVISECLIGAIEARVGSIQDSISPIATTRLNGHQQISKDCCGDGILEVTTRLGRPPKSTGLPNHAAENFYDFIYRVWGTGIAKHFAIPYNQKLWAVPLQEMETSWLGGRVPLPDLKEMISGALTPTPKPMGPNARFGYPLKGGFQALMDGFLPLLDGDLLCGVSVTRISPKSHKLELSNGQTIFYDQLVSSMPLPALIRCCGECVPGFVHDAAKKLKAISVRCVHLGIGRADLTEKHWIYYPEDTVFHRVFAQGNASPHCNPKGGFGLTCEITYHPNYKPLPVDGEDLIDLCIRDCQRVGLFTNSDPVWARAQVDLPFAYVVYDHERKQNVEIIREWLSRFDIYLAGRYSEWEYFNSDHAFLSGKKAAESVLTSQRQGLVKSPATQPMESDLAFSHPPAPLTALPKR